MNVKSISSICIFASVSVSENITSDATIGLTPPHALLGCLCLVCRLAGTLVRSLIGVLQRISHQHGKASRVPQSTTVHVTEVAGTVEYVEQYRCNEKSEEPAIIIDQVELETKLVQSATKQNEHDQNTMVFSEYDGKPQFKDSHLFQILNGVAKSRKMDRPERHDTVRKPLANRFKFDFDWSEGVEEEDERQRQLISLTQSDNQSVYFRRKTVLPTIIEEEEEE